MQVTFRVDASLDIGIGHVMRCLTLADALVLEGAECRFVCRTHPGNLLREIEQRGHAVIGLAVPAGLAPATAAMANIDYSTWLGVDWQTDASETAAVLRELPSDWLIVDHYSLDIQWEKAISPHCRKLMVIDDLANRAHDCDLLLDQNLGREAQDYLAHVPARCELLIGPSHALLRPEFSAIRADSLARRQPPALAHILITMGGVDQMNATSLVLAALPACPLPADCEITVVMGPHAPWLQSVRELAQTMPWPIAVKTDVKDMARTMAESDLAIGAAGSTSWERCCLGLPTLMVVLADNQRQAADALAKAGAAFVIRLGSDLESELRERIGMMFNAPEVMLSMIADAQKVTAGNGSALVVKALAEHLQ